MKITPLALLASLVLVVVGCSAQPDPTPAPVPTPQNLWVTAASLPDPHVPYMPAPIVTARETDAGMWVWKWRSVVTAPARTLSVEQLLREVTETRPMRPKPMILFNFAHHPNSAELAHLRSRIAIAWGCTPEDPCIEGTPEQLR